MNRNDLIVAWFFATLFFIVAIIYASLYNASRATVNEYRHVLINNHLATYTIGIDGKVTFEIKK